MVILSDSLVSLPYFQLRDGRAGWGFRVLCNAQLFFLQCICLNCKGNWVFNPVFGPLKIPKLQITRNRDSKTGMQGSLFLQNTKESANLNMRCSSGDLIKFKRCSKAVGVGLCHGAVYCCGFSSSSTNTVCEWGWQIKQKALGLLYFKEAIPEAAVSKPWAEECWREEAVLFL